MFPSVLALQHPYAPRGRRRGRNDPNSRDFICPCGKSYLSYPALFTHIKIKHNGRAPGQIIKPKVQNLSRRGRPRIKQLNDGDSDTNDLSMNCVDRLCDFLLQYQKPQILLQQRLGLKQLYIKSQFYRSYVDFNPQQQQIHYNQDEDLYEQTYSNVFCELIVEFNKRINEPFYIDQIIILFMMFQNCISDIKKKGNKNQSDGYVIYQNSIHLIQQDIQHQYQRNIHNNINNQYQQDQEDQEDEEIYQNQKILMLQGKQQQQVGVYQINHKLLDNYQQQYQQQQQQQEQQQKSDNVHQQYQDQQKMQQQDLPIHKTQILQQQQLQIQQQQKQSQQLNHKQPQIQQKDLYQQQAQYNHGQKPFQQQYQQQIIIQQYKQQQDYHQYQQNNQVTEFSQQPIRNIVNFINIFILQYYPKYYKQYKLQELQFFNPENIKKFIELFFNWLTTKKYICYKVKVNQQFHQNNKNNQNQVN